MVRRKYAKKEILLAAGCVLLAIGTLTFYIWQQSVLINLGYESSKLERVKARVEEDIRRLDTEKATLLALDKVERIAREELQLESPRQDQIIYEGLTAPEAK
jgi:cell division protein FtsL